ncbi:MAG: lipid-binding SYLF domain-containing protein [Verrucomicrobiales bacterium]|jgi:lipid-binding SYLF domain-containing protein
MKTSPTLVSILFLALASFSLAGPFDKSPEKLDQKIRAAKVRLDTIQATERRIPAFVLQNAKGIIMLHQVKAGFGIGGQAGGGVALVKDANGNWGTPAFVASAEASWGLQIGAQESTIFLVLMDNAGLKILSDARIGIGVDIQASAGPADVGGDAKIDNIDSPVLVYSDSGGLFAGAAFEGGGIVPAKKNNAIYYGESLQQILFKGAGRRTASGQALIDRLNRYMGVVPKPAATATPVKS